MKKGFTLVELLAVIAIIAIIATITTPLILNVISTSKEKSFKDSAYSLVFAAVNYQALAQKNNRDVVLTIDYANDSSEKKSLLKTKGKLPDAGQLKIDENGKVTLALWSDDAKICAIKKNNEKNITLSKISKTQCVIGND